MSEIRRGRSRGHKDLQVCRQVADAVSWFLAEVDDPVLAEQPRRANLTSARKPRIGDRKSVV